MDMKAGHSDQTAITLPSYSTTTVPSIGGLKFSIIIALRLWLGDRLTHLL